MFIIISSSFINRGTLTPSIFPTFLDLILNHLILRTFWILLKDSPPPPPNVMHYIFLVAFSFLYFWNLLAV